MSSERRQLQRTLLLLAPPLVGLGVFVGLMLQPRPQIPTPTPAQVYQQVARGVVSVQLMDSDGRIGSGFAVAPDRVLTAQHVVYGSSEVRVMDVRGRTLAATVVGTDARNDLALLEVEDGNLVPLALSGQAVPVGEQVLAIGNPYGLGHSLTVGVVGGVGRQLDRSSRSGPRTEVLQLSMALNPGNSGGPVLDLRGQVIGVLTGTHPQGQAIAFAVPSTTVSESLPSLLQGEHLSRAFLGLSAETRDGAVVVTSVIPGSPAADAGIRPGDQLSAFAGTSLYSDAQLQGLLDTQAGGRLATLRLLRDGELHVVDVRLADWAQQPMVAAGMTLKPVPGSGGEVVAVRPRSRAERAGVERGDRLRAINGVPCRAPADVRDALMGAPAALVEVERDGTVHLLQFSTSSP